MTVHSRDANIIRAACTRFVSGHYPQTPQQLYAAMARTTAPDAQADYYGAGKLIEDFEAEVADES